MQQPLPAWQRLLGQVAVGIAIPLTAAPVKTAAGAGPLAAPPAAVLRYELRLVRDQSLVRSGTQAITAAAEGAWELLSLEVKGDTEEPAELAVWVENPEATPVYFDDLRVEHQQGPVVAENHFYPYGQRNAGLSWARSAVRAYGRGYQGQSTRFDEETGYDAFELRNYDARIGRWLSPDPMGQYHSPYVGMGNDPVNGTDPDGGFSDYWDTQGNLVSHVDDGSTAQFRQTGSGINLHYAFAGYANVPGQDFVSYSGLQAAQQDLNLSNSSLQQVAPGSATYCNFATQNIMKALIDILSVGNQHLSSNFVSS